MGELQSSWQVPAAVTALAILCLAGGDTTPSSERVTSAHWDIGVACEPGTQAAVASINGVAPGADTGVVFVDCLDLPGGAAYAPEAMNVAGSGTAPRRILGCANVVTIDYTYNPTDQQPTVALTVSRGEVALLGVANITRLHVMHSLDGCKRSPTAT